MAEMLFPWLLFTGVGGKKPVTCEGAPILKQVAESVDWKCDNVPGYRHWLDLTCAQIGVTAFLKWRNEDDLTEAERAAIQKVADNEAELDKAMAGSRLILTEAEMHTLAALRNRKDQERWQRDKEEHEENLRELGIKTPS